MYEPDIAAELSGLAHLEEDGGGEHQRGCRRMVVVGTGRRDTGAIALVRAVTINVLHIGRVIVVGEDHGLPPVATGDDGQDIALERGALVIGAPAAHPAEVE